MIVDVLINNGLVVDGSGKEGQRRAVAIKGDKIILPEAAAEIEAKHVIDAEGLVVAPGFIDIHSHTTLGTLTKSQGGSKLSQGITTEITGNCGMFPAPLVEESGEMELSVRDIDWSPEGYRKYLAQFANTDISLNLGFYIGHGAIRAAAMGYDDRKPTSAELEKMKQYVAEGMKYGAMGLSTGLGYSPGMFAEIEELVELCRVVAQYGGIYATHMRDEGDGVLDSIDESIEIARQANIPLQVSHLKAVGKQNRGKVVTALKKLEAAEQAGLDISFDFYPYTASSTGLNSQLPNWVHEGGWEKAALRICDPPQRAQIIGEIKPKLEAAVGWHSIFVSSINSLDNRSLEGKNLEQIGEIRGQHPVQVMLNLLVEENGHVGMIKFSLADEDVSTVAAHRMSMVGSDGYALPLNDPKNRKPHPRSYGTFPRVFRLFLREQQLLSLENLVHKMTQAPAIKLKLNKRGVIAEGFFADLVIFDPEKISDMATFDDPHQLSTGIHSVFVNGKKAYELGQFLDPKSGVMIRPGL